MKKRLRKKLRLREFQKIGFQVIFTLKKIENDPESPQYFWNRLTKFVESNRLLILGAEEDVFHLYGL